MGGSSRRGRNAPKKLASEGRFGEAEPEGRASVREDAEECVMNNNEIVRFDLRKEGEVVYADFAYITRYGS